MIALLSWLALGYCLSCLFDKRPTIGTMLAIGMALYIPFGFFAALFSLPFITGILFPLVALGGLAFALWMGKGWRGGLVMPSLFVLIPGILLAGFLALQLGYPLANYDILSYHIPLAASFAGGDGGHGVLSNPDTFYARLPLGAPILQAPLYSSSLLETLRLPGLPFLVLVGIIGSWSIVYRLVRWHGGRRVAGILAILMIGLLPMNVNALRAGLFDPLLGLFALAALELILIARGSPGRIFAWLCAGLVMGGAVALKLNAVGVVLIPLLALACLFVYLARNYSPAARGVALLLLAVGIMVSVAPWAIRGLPVGPFAIVSTEWTVEQARFVVDVHEPIAPLSPSWWSDFPLKLKSLGYPLPLVGIPILLLLAGAEVLKRRTLRLELWLLLAAMAGFSAWLCVRHNPARFLLPSCFLLIPPAAAYLARPLHFRFGARWGLPALFAVVGLLPAALPQFQLLRVFPPIFDREKREHALGEMVGEPVMQIVRLGREEIERGGRVLLFFEGRMGFFPNDGVEGRTVWDQPSWVEKLRDSRDEADFRQKLVGAGYTTILVNEVEWGRLLDFYASDHFDTDAPLRGRMGMTSRVVSGEEINRGLAVYPPHRFAGLTDRDLTILHDFLLTCRGTTPLVVTAGTGAEVWFARLNQHVP
ncbi:MAG: hypothetical protein JJU11_10830 [Candidatus Sumerlaeia bacterium]|nr:hypothetical protein [Candidatus Sumerlaeia bacterium]